MVDVNGFLGLLRHRNYRLLVSGSTVSALGNSIAPVALAFAVLDLGGSATDLGSSWRRSLSPRWSRCCSAACWGTDCRAS